jgi:hypothetical protein
MYNTAMHIHLFFFSNLHEDSMARRGGLLVCQKSGGDELTKQFRTLAADAHLHEEFRSGKPGFYSAVSVHGPGESRAGLQPIRLYPVYSNLSSFPASLLSPLPLFFLLSTASDDGFSDDPCRSAYSRTCRPVPGCIRLATSCDLSLRCPLGP